MGGWCAQIGILHVQTVLKKVSGISEPELVINQFCRCIVVPSIISMDHDVVYLYHVHTYIIIFYMMYTEFIYIYER